MAPIASIPATAPICTSVSLSAAQTLGEWLCEWVTPDGERHFADADRASIAWRTAQLMMAADPSITAVGLYQRVPVTGGWRWRINATRPAGR